MSGKNHKRGRKRAFVPNISQRSVEGSTVPARKPTTLPPQYNFTPTVNVPPIQSPQELSPELPQASMPTHVRNYPLPQQLFQKSTTQGHQTPRQGSQVQNELQSTPLHNSQPSCQFMLSQTHPPPHEHTEEVQNDQHSAPNLNPPAAPREYSQNQSLPTSSQGNNFQEEAHTTTLQEDTVRDLYALLQVPDRHLWTTVLSPTERPNTFWFTRDKKSKLVRAITRVFTNKFDEPFYNWSCVPPERRERYFIEFAKTHTWDPLITGTVQHYFYEICKRRMKDMVSNARTSRERPSWIKKTLWKTMVAYWDTEEAQERSKLYSKARMSDRNGLGPHVHLSGLKSYQQIKEEMEDKLGRPVSFGEVFRKTHTKADGTYVDRKAEIIAKAFQKNMQDKLAELEAESSCVTDGASRPLQLIVDEQNAIFLQSTEKDSRGNLFGVGSLKETFVNGKRKQPGDSAAFVEIQDQLKEAQRKIEEQAAYNERRDTAVAARDAEIAAVKQSIPELWLSKRTSLSTCPWWRSICDKLIQLFWTLWNLIHLQEPRIFPRQLELPILHPPPS